MPEDQPKDQNVLELDLTPTLAKQILKEIVEADDGRVFFRPHADERMAQRGITRPQVYRCLKCGRFVEEPYWSDRYGNWEMKLEVVSAGDIVSVVAALDYDEDRNITNSNYNFLSRML